MSNRVYVRDESYGGINLYTVMVNDKPYDQMVSTTRLTFRDQHDIAAGYAEALDSAPAP